jgi:hypothetical protein
MPGLEPGLNLNRDSELTLLLSYISRRSLIIHMVNFAKIRVYCSAIYQSGPFASVQAHNKFTMDINTKILEGEQQLLIFNF